MAYYESGSRTLDCNAENRTEELCLVIWDDPNNDDESDWFYIQDPPDPNNELPSHDMFGNGWSELEAKRYAEFILPEVRLIELEPGLIDDCHDVLYLDSFRITEMACATKWKVTARYTDRLPRAPGYCHVDFSLRSSSINIQQGKRHIKSYYAPPDGAIARIECFDVAQYRENFNCESNQACAPTTGIIQDYVNGAQLDDITICYIPPDFCDNGPLYFQVEDGQVTGTVEPFEGDCDQENPFNGAINVVGDTVQGKQIPVGEMALSVTAYFHACDLPCDYYDMLSEAQNTINNFPFFCWARGEVLFEGASGTRQGRYVCFTFDFAISKNVVDETIGNITGIDKLGWECIWFYYKAKPIPDCHIVTQVPHSAHVEQVFCFSDFSCLNLPCGNLGDF